MNHADPERARGLRVRDAHRVAVEADFTAVGLIDAREDFHQRGFSGAVLADERGDRPARQVEARALERTHAAE